MKKILTLALLSMAFVGSVSAMKRNESQESPKKGYLPAMKLLAENCSSRELQDLFDHLQGKLNPVQDSDWDSDGTPFSSPSKTPVTSPSPRKDTPVNSPSPKKQPITVDSLEGLFTNAINLAKKGQKKAVETLMDAIVNDASTLSKSDQEELKTGVILTLRGTTFKWHSNGYKSLEILKDGTVQFKPSYALKPKPLIPAHKPTMDSFTKKTQELLKKLK